MAVYVATFFSHFGATRFRRDLAGQGVPCCLMPVPRAVSSSCGTCVEFEAAEPQVDSEDVEALFLRTDHGFERVFSNL